jgi:hypothetical protein
LSRVSWKFRRLEKPSASRDVSVGEDIERECIMKRFSIVVLTLGMGLSSVAFAQLPPPPANIPQWYIGGGVGGGHLNRSGGDLTGLDDASVDNHDTTWTARGGWRFSPYGAVELGYYDFGRYKFHGSFLGQEVDGSARAQSVGLSLVGIIPISTVDLYGRIGIAESKLKFNANGPIDTSNANERQTEATYGVGARWAFAPNWDVFGEWAKNDRIRVDAFLAGIDYRF